MTCLSTGVSLKSENARILFLSLVLILPELPLSLLDFCLEPYFKVSLIPKLSKTLKMSS